MTLQPLRVACTQAPNKRELQSLKAGPCSWPQHIFACSSPWPLCICRTQQHNNLTQSGEVVGVVDVDLALVVVAAAVITTTITTVTTVTTSTATSTVVAVAIAVATSAATSAVLTRLFASASGEELVCRDETFLLLLGTSRADLGCAVGLDDTFVLAHDLLAVDLGDSADGLLGAGQSLERSALLSEDLGESEDKENNNKNTAHEEHREYDGGERNCNRIFFHLPRQTSTALHRTAPPRKETKTVPM